MKAAPEQLESHPAVICCGVTKEFGTGDTKCARSQASTWRSRRAR